MKPRDERAFGGGIGHSDRRSVGFDFDFMLEEIAKPGHNFGRGNVDNDIFDGSEINLFHSNLSKVEVSITERERAVSKLLLPEPTFKTPIIGGIHLHF
jgi:hypothetical protein